MLQDQLKKRAKEISAIPENYVLEIEDYLEDENVKRSALYLWSDPNKVDSGIWIELDKHGNLLDFTRRMTKELGSMVEEEMKVRALEFVMHHYPDALNIFSIEEIIQNENGSLRVTYVERKLDYPLPHTGFSIEITSGGEIVEFHYDGKAENVIKPSEILSKDLVISNYFNDFKMDLLITNISSELYEEGDNLPHLVYEGMIRCSGDVHYCQD